MRVPAEITALALILGTAGGSAMAVAVLGAPPRQTGALPTLAPPTPARSPTPIPAILPGPLNGEPTARDLALRRPMAVVVDNYFPDARPQSGLSHASVVYETVVEGGITRLMVIFLEHDASAVGPIRSARPYFVRWAAGYGALFVHEGGSPASLRLIKTMRTVGDVEAGSSASEFYTEPSRTVPHDLFSSTRGIIAVVRRRGGTTVPRYSWTLHKKAAAPKSRGRGRVARIDFSTPTVTSPSSYNVTYRFDRSRDVYTRFVGGSPALDADNGKPLTAANIVVLATSITPIPNDPEQRVSVRAIGSGPATVLQDGRVVKGTWTKSSASGALKLWSHGRQIRLNPGTTWVEVAPPGALRFGK